LVRKYGIARGTFPILALTLVRVALAVFWLSQLGWKPPPTFGCPDGGLCLWFDRQIQYPFVPAYADLVSTLIRPNVLVFGWLVALLEAAIGGSLLLGVLTRLGGFLGMLWSLVILIAMVAVPGETVWYYFSLVLLDFLFFAIGGSTQVSVDLVVRSRTWWAEAE